MKAFVTLLSDERYFDGVAVLNRSLRAVRSQYPLYCVLSADIEDAVEERLRREGVPSIRLGKQAVPSEQIPSDNGFAHWNKTFDKLQIWGLTQFEKLVYLDSDLLIVNNVDDLFQREPFSGVCAGKSYPGNEDWRGINSGVVVISPNRTVEQALIALIPTVAEAYKAQNRPLGDQDILQWYLTDEWSRTPSLQLDEGYNLFADYLTYYVRQLGYSWDSEAERVIYAVHFVGRTKPWMKLSLRERCRLLKKLMLNPLYREARRRYRRYLFLG